MNPQSTQASNQSNQNMANLGFVNNMQDQLLKYRATSAQPPQTTQNPNPMQPNSPSQDGTAQIEDLKSKISEIEGKMQTLSDDSKETIKMEVDQLREDIKNALSQETN